jgi:hypothetical protein
LAAALAVPGAVDPGTNGGAEPVRVPGQAAVGAGAVGGGVPGIALVALGLAVGAAAGAAGQAFFTPPETKVVYLERRVERTRVTMIPAPSTAPSSPPSSPLELAPVRQARGPAAVSSAGEEPGAVTPEVEQPGELGPEVTLLDRARRALSEGDAARAQALLLEHARRFPKSLLTQEREALVIKALAASGRRDAARARAAEFEQRYPKSLLLDSIKKAL